MGGVSNRHLDGSIDNMGIWNRVLTSAEVASLYAGNNPTTISSGLVASYNFEQTSGNLLDQTNSNDGVNNGATTGTLGVGSGSTTNIISATGLTDNTSSPQHYSFVRDGNNWAIYQNGVSQATATDTTSLGSNVQTNTGVKHDENQDLCCGNSMSNSQFQKIGMVLKKYLYLILMQLIKAHIYYSHFLLIKIIIKMKLLLIYIKF